MFCCALGTVILASLALWRKRLRRLFMGRVTARTAMAGLFVIGMTLAGLILVTEHFGHAIASAGTTIDGPLCGEVLSRSDR